MKILICSTYHLPHISGITTYVQRLAEGLTKKGHKVTILTSKHQANLSNRQAINGVNMLRVSPAFPLGKGVIMPTFPYACLKEASRHDVINCHLPQLESFWLAIAGLILKKKIVFTHHVELPKSSNFTEQIATNIVFLGQLISTPPVSTITTYTKDYAKHSSAYLRLYKSKVKAMFPPVVMAPPQKEIIKKIRKNMAVKPDDIVIGFVGRIAKEKGIDLLLKTIPLLKKELKNFKIILFGPHAEVVGDSTFQKLKRKLNRYEKEGILKVYGSFDPFKIANIYRSIDLLVLPSNSESFGIVQVEAMLNKCPVVSPNLPGARVPVKITGMGEIFSPNNVSSLAKKIVAVVKNKNKYAQNFKKAKEKFQYQKTINFYEKLFQQSINHD